MNVFQILALVQAVLSIVHSVQAAMPKSSGAEKSAEVIAKITPVANALQASAAEVQTIIDAGVSIFKGAGAWLKDEAPEPANQADIGPALGAVANAMRMDAQGLHACADDMIAAAQGVSSPIAP